MSDEELLRIKIPDRINLRLNNNDPEDVRFYLAYQKAKHKKETIREAFLSGNHEVTTSYVPKNTRNAVTNYKNEEIEEAGMDFLSAIGIC